MRKRKHTYIATIWRYDSADRAHTRQPAEYNLGSDLDSARKRARALLPVRAVEATRYTWGREQARADHVALRRREVRQSAGRIVRADVGRYEWFLPEVQIVPSVGELGWTP